MKLYETVVNLQNIHILSIHGLQINRFHRCLIWKVKMREWENDRKQQHFSGPCPQTSPNIPRPAPYLSQELGLGQVQIVHLQELDHDKVLEIHPTWRFRPRNSDSPSWRPQGKPNRAVSYHSSCPSQKAMTKNINEDSSFTSRFVSCHVTSRGHKMAVVVPAKALRVTRSIKSFTRSVQNFGASASVWLVFKKWTKTTNNYNNYIYMYIILYLYLNLIDFLVIFRHLAQGKKNFAIKMMQKVSCLSR